MPLHAPMPSADPVKTLCAPSRIQKDFRAWLLNNQERLQLGADDVEWYAKQMECADEFGWKCNGGSVDLKGLNGRGIEYAFTWTNPHGSKVTGAWHGDVYEAFLNSLRARASSSTTARAMVADTTLASPFHAS